MTAPQLPALHQALDDNERRAHALAAQATRRDAWTRRPADGRWSPSECVQHLIITIDGFLPLVDAALEKAGANDTPSHGPFTPDLMGRLLLWVLEPPYRIRTRTPARFVPDTSRPADIDLAALVGQHDAWRQRMRHAAGQPLHAIRIASPFVRGTSYSLYSTFCIVPVHERRHLWQAEQALAAVRQHSLTAERSP